MVIILLDILFAIIVISGLVFAVMHVIANSWDFKSPAGSDTSDIEVEGGEGYFKKHKLLLDSVEVPEDYVPIIQTKTINFFGNIFREIRFDSIVIREYGVLVETGGVLLPCADTDEEGHLIWEERTPDILIALVNKILYSCDRILEAEISAICRDISTEHEEEIQNYQGIKVKKS